MKRSRMWLVIAATVGVAVVVGLAVGGLASAETAPSGPRRLVTVTGTATVTSRPDEAVVELGVRSQAVDGAAAMRANAQKMAAVLKALGGAGVDRQHVETLDVSLGRTTIGKGTSGEHTEFVASNTVRATITDLQTTGEVVDAAVRAGAEEVRDIRFQVSDPSEVRRRALQQAVLSSRAKATAMADAAGASIASVFSIREQGSPDYRVAFDQAIPAAYGSLATPIVPERDIETRVTVSVVWTLS